MYLSFVQMRTLGQAITVLQCANRDSRGNPSEGRIVCLVFHAIPGHTRHTQTDAHTCRFVRVPPNNSTSIVISSFKLIHLWGLTFIHWSTFNSPFFAHLFWPYTKSCKHSRTPHYLLCIHTIPSFSFRRFSPSEKTPQPKWVISSILHVSATNDFPWLFSAFAECSRHNECFCLRLQKFPLSKSGK